MVGSPAISSVQTTLDGGICEVGESEVHERAPCDEKCWRAVEERCVCRCGGLNHGRAWRNNASLDSFDSEGAPIVSRDITRGRLELVLLARRELVGAYAVALGGLRE